jgi:putative copper resistance protein D
LSPLLEIARIVTFAAALQLFGAAAFQWLLCPERLRRALDAPLRPLATVAAAAMLAGEVLWLAATAGSLGDGWSDAFNPATLLLVLQATQFGHVWIATLALTAGLVVLSVLRVNWLWLLVIAGIALAALGLVGHGASLDGIAGVFNRLSQMLHLLSSGFWIGALIPLLFCLRYFRDPALVADADRTLRRFSGFGHFAVAILLLSGVANSYFLLGATVPDITVPYQALLVIKIVLAGVMCGLAIVNRYVFVPRIPNDGSGLRQLRHGTIAEMVMSAGILLLVSLLGTLPPT